MRMKEWKELDKGERRMLESKKTEGFYWERRRKKEGVAGKKGG